MGRRFNSCHNTLNSATETDQGSVFTPGRRQQAAIGFQALGRRSK
ncbi:hypothetical protein R3I94_007835 [Phoxinus phoxinus]